MGTISEHKVLTMKDLRQPKNEKSRVPNMCLIEEENDYIQEHELFEEHRKKIIEELEKGTTKEVNVILL